MIVNRLAVERAVEALCDGGVIAYPTEGVWGLGADPLDRAAVRRVGLLKRRPPLHGYILVAAEEQQLAWCLDRVTPEMRAEMRASWPGPVTWVVPASSALPGWVNGRFDTVAVRVSAHPVVSAICRMFDGPIISTSANPHGLPPARDRLKLQCYFGDQLDQVVPGQLGGNLRPTTIRDARTGAVLRA